MLEYFSNLICLLNKKNLQVILSDKTILQSEIQEFLAC